MYANFGIVGILIVPFILGYGLYWLNAIILRLQPTPLSIALIVWVMMHFKALSVTGASGFLLDTYFLAVLSCFVALAFFAGRGVIKFRQNTSQPNGSSRNR
jgi:F0F1-type ATP synthase membrane subunit a